MHELSLSSAIVNTVVKHAQERAVGVVNLRVGALRQVVPDTLEFYFGFVAKGTVCEGARLEQELVPARLQCTCCEQQWEMDLPIFRCAGCGDAWQGGGGQRERIRGGVDRGRGGSLHRTKVKIVEEALDANNTIAQANRADFDRAGVKVVNFMSAPGAGKTSLLERTIADLPGVRVGVLEGDVQGSMDADRLSALHVPVTQLNTAPSFGGECHLDANMVRSALGDLPLDEIDLLVIENVGNLVCPAEFRVGEDARIMVSAVTEGEEKPAKYPLMFRACELVLINKIDLLPHLDFDLDKFLYHLEAVHPGVERILVSAKTGEGIDEWRDWLARAGAPAVAEAPA